MKRKRPRPPELAGPPDPALGQANYERVIVRGRRAKKRCHNFQLEAVAARAYILDRWLRHFLTGRTISFRGQATLGELIEAAATNGLDAALLVDLRNWVEFRNEAIHNLRDGRIAYDDLSDYVFARYPNLHVRLERWVVQEVGPA